MKKKLAVLVLVFFIAGCREMPRGGTRGFLPKIPKPERPVLEELTKAEIVDLDKLQPETKAKIQRNMAVLFTYTKKMEIGIDAYNAYVKTNNAMVRQELGMPPSPDPEAKLVENEVRETEPDE
jgi:hypothetical protein